MYYYTSIQVYLAKSPGDLAKPPGDLAPHFAIFACVFAAAPPPSPWRRLRRRRSSCDVSVAPRKSSSFRPQKGAPTEKIQDLERCKLDMRFCMVPCFLPPQDSPKWPQYGPRKALRFLRIVLGGPDISPDGPSMDQACIRMVQHSSRLTRDGPLILFETPKDRHR